MSQERAQELYEQLSNFANGNRMYGKHVGEAMIKDHPLLQSYVIGIMLDMIKAMANHDNVTPQNEKAVKLCKEITECIGDYPQYL